MILNFQLTSKHYHQKIFIESTTHMFLECRCDHCGAIGHFHRHGSYSRFFITFESELPQIHTIDILRLQCVSCKKTHSILPRDVIPFQLHSLPYVLTLLYTFYTQTSSKRSTAKHMKVNLDFVRRKLLLFLQSLSSIEAFLRETDVFTSNDNLSIETALSYLFHAEFDLRDYFRTHNVPLFLNRRNTNAYPLRFIPFSI